MSKRNKIVILLAVVAIVLGYVVGKVGDVSSDTDTSSAVSEDTGSSTVEVIPGGEGTTDTDDAVPLEDDTELLDSDAAGGDISDEAVTEDTEDGDTVDTSDDTAEASDSDVEYRFRNDDLWTSHFEKHGDEFPYNTKEEYLEGAIEVIENPDSLHKYEAEDGDEIYYLESENKIVFVTTDGIIRTYFRPSAGKDYYDRQ